MYTATTTTSHTDARSTLARVYNVIDKYMRNVHVSEYRARVDVYECMCTHLTRSVVHTRYNLLCARLTSRGFEYARLA